MTTSISHLPHPKYRADIDGLRAVAVLAVVAYHAFPVWMKGGFIGVDIFFVISGFLISSIIFENLDRGTFSFSEFYARRIKRIFPALLLILLAVHAFGWFALLTDEYKQLGKHMAAGAGFVSNFVLWDEAGYFDITAENKPLLHLWSLGIEEQFYIIWPLILWVTWKGKFNLLTLTLLVALVSFVLNVKGVKQDSVATFYSPQTRFWELLSGSILAWFSLYKKNSYSDLKLKIDSWLAMAVYREGVETDRTTLSNALSILGCMLLAYGFLRISKTVNYPGSWAVVPVLGAMLIILAGQKAWINRTIFSNKIAVWFGLISFPLYLWHWPILSFARIVESEMPSRTIRITAVVLSIALAWLTYKLVERPIRLGNGAKVKVLVLVVLMIIIGYLGYNMYSRDGYEFRSTIKRFANNKNELTRTPAKDEECLNYAGLKKPLFTYCRFTNVNSTETVAVFGDSHAHVAYPGIAEFLKNKGVNTVLLATSGCPPFLGSPTGINQAKIDTCRDGTAQLLEVVNSHKDIKRVFIFTRGAFYNTGTEPVTGNRDIIGGNIISIDKLAKSAQLSINSLSKTGKSIFYVTENPELNYSAESCLARPFKSTVRNCSVDRSVVLERQKDYLKAFNKLKNVIIIDSLSIFCPEKKCIVFDDDGSLLYADDDHLSVAGSKFQVNKLLMPFLEQVYD